ncbi:GntR family transcriptional regulator [Actinoplanes sp. CA-015351]|uniref:GntR family transcriptional regulator n=1 Tax=Actinoplanes sp. CA-015351 TaxID=3239897 RepID=UPI003D98C0F1
MTSLRSVKRSTLSEDVYETLRSAVLEHSLAPGDRLNIDGLARELEVSPTPVREALARLESEGLVRKRALAGYTVSPLLTREEFADLFDMRLLLECAAARRAAAHATEAQRSSLVAQAGGTVLDNGDEKAWHAAFTAQDAQLHRLVVQSSGSPLLLEAFTRLHAHLHLHRRYFPYSHTAVTHQEHRDLAEAIANRDAERAEATMRQHLRQARDRHLVAFTQ